MLNSQNNTSQLSKQYHHILRQSLGVLYKNYRNHISNKKKLIGELILPLIISVIYFINQKMKTANPLVGLLLGMLLKIYIGLVAISAVRQLITLFITERCQNFRQYQMIFGMSHRVHTLSNLFYMCLYLSCSLLPFYLTICYFDFKLIHIFYFGSFVISTCTLAMTLTAFFKDHKIALQIIGTFLSLGSFLPFLFDGSGNSYNFVDYLAMIMPNSAFTLAILNGNTTASFISLFCVKFYLLLYSMVQFPQYYVQILGICRKKISQFIPIFDRQPNNLMEQFQLNEVINDELDQNSMLHHNKKIVIKTEGLVKTYTVNKCKVNALNGVNLKIYKSEIFGLLGRNGAGKTSLVDILTSVTKPSLGTYQIVNHKQTIGICYQHQVLYQNLTVQQHLYFYSLVKPMELENEQTRESHIEDIIRTLNIESQRKKQVKELSGGNKRKLSIAIAIIGKPQILIFDEPTSGLDPLSRIYVWEIFQKLRQMESTIILTTHHLDQAQKLSDWICVIEKGSVIVENTAQKIKQKYGKGYHLNILLKNKQGSNVSFTDVEQFKTIIESLKLRSLQLEHVNNQINFLVKPLNKDIESADFQNSFIQLIERLQKNSNLELRFHSNTLEESFIAIIKDSDNSSGDSLGEQISYNRQNHDLSYYSPLTRGFYQIIGVILKNLYYQKSVFLQAILIFNINILIILISSAFNELISKLITDNNTSVAVKDGDEISRKGTMLLQGYLIMATAFISCPVYEKQKKIRAVFNTRGLNGILYWIGNFIFDYTFYVINLLVLGKLIAPQLIDSVGWTTLLHLGIGILLYTYCFSFLFDKLKTASTYFSVINMVMGIVIMPMILFGNNTYFHYLDFLKYLYPYYDLTIKIFFQGKSMDALKGLINIQKPQDSTIFISIAIYFTILLLLEFNIPQRIKTAWKNQEEEQNQLNQTVKLENITKNYGKIQALKNVSYHVNQERLALLGHNGAGKSTTFGLLSSQLNPDSGKLYLQKQIHKPYKNVLNSAGICYQDDSLWQGMLVSEILTIVSYIVPIQNSDRQIKWMFQNIQYDPNNTYKRFSNLSGGNKRKLCMMVALYGDPSLRLLDECSTGLDPSSRLAMVDTIKHSLKGTTIFTTHSMAQAESLCTKAVIMSKGKVLEFDYICKLRAKHFHCCWVDLKYVVDDNQQQTKAFIIKQVKRDGVYVQVKQKGQMRLQIIKTQVKMSLLLRSLQKLKQLRLIANYSNVQPRLQDVYIKVTRQSGEVVEQNTGLNQNIEII